MFFFISRNVSIVVDRETVVKKVIEDLISPGALSQKYQIGVAKIKAWVKEAGHKMPKSFKITESDEATKPM